MRLVTGIVIGENVQYVVSKQLVKCMFCSIS